MKYGEYKITKLKGKIKITNGIGTIVIDKELLKILEELLDE